MSWAHLTTARTCARYKWSGSVQGRSATVLSLMGALAVLAIAVRGGMLLIERCQRLEREEGQRFGPALVVMGAQGRFDSVVLSTAASAAALLPLLVYAPWRAWRSSIPWRPW